jgi:hypothetical protein
VKKGYYLTRGKIHLTKDEEVTYCGVKLEDVNGSTTELDGVTCQKCLMFKTQTWRRGVKSEVKEIPPVKTRKAKKRAR